MKKILIFSSALIVSALLLPILLTTLVPGIGFSFLLRNGENEIRAVLPPDRYVIAISTNDSDHAFSIIPVHQDYLSEVTMTVFNQRGILLEMTNMNYASFSTKRPQKSEVTFIVRVQNQSDEKLWLYVKRPFRF